MEQDDWEIVKTPPTPKLDHPTMADMFAYLLEVEGHRAIDPDKRGEWDNAVAPNVWCQVGRGRYRIQCPSCTALRLYANQERGKIKLSKGVDNGGMDGIMASDSGN